MKTLVLSLALLFSFSASADWESFLRTPIGGLVKAGILATGGSSGSSGRMGGIQKAHDKETCVDAFGDSEEKWDKSNSAINAAYLLSPITAYDIKNAGDNTSLHNIGLDSDIKLRVNSWNPKTAPHMESQCKKHYQVIESFMVDNGEERCRIVTVGIDDNSYNVLYCEGSQHIQIDPSKSHLVEFKQD